MHLINKHVRIQQAARRQCILQFHKSLGGRLPDITLLDASVGVAVTQEPRSVPNMLPARGSTRPGPYDHCSSYSRRTAS
jgi:hypothetical protein